VAGREPATWFKVLAQNWKSDDVDDDDWHEDTFEWREKDRNAKPQAQFDPNNPQAFLSQAMSGSGMQMMFVQLYRGLHVSKKETEELGVMWTSECAPCVPVLSPPSPLLAAMLKTDGVQTIVYTVDVNQLIFTQEDGRSFEVKEFILSQPEVEKFRWKDKDWFPEDHHLKKRRATLKSRGEDPKLAKRRAKRAKKDFDAAEKKRQEKMAQKRAARSSEL
jgi:thiol-disulfide isomerase/thioredoxin